MRKALLYSILGAYAIMWAGGVVSYVALGGPPDDTAWAAPAFLALACAAMFVFAGKRQAVDYVLCGVIGFAAEVMGVAFGIPFGSYEYTSVLAPHLFGVPLVLFCAWIVVFAYAREIVGFAVQSRWTAALLVAALMTAFDLLIDPLAAGPMGFWRWEHTGGYFGIPLTNFAGWFVVSFVIAVVASRPDTVDRGALFVGASVVVFFLAVALAHLMIVPALVGAAILALHAVVARRRVACGTPGDGGE